jgi:hypothetical protein
LDIYTFQKKISLKWLVWASVAILTVILFFGLRPKGYSHSNNVKWIGDQSGIRFGQYGLAYTDPIKELSRDDSSGADGFSIEIAFKPLSFEERFRFILSLHAGEDRDQLLVGQWRSWQIVMNGDDYAHRRRTKRIGVNSDTQPPEMQFVTITTGKEGTKVFVDGHIRAARKDFKLNMPNGDNVRLLLGNSVYGRHPWKGEIHGLAIYGYTLAAKVVAEHFSQWSADRSFLFAAHARPFILYLFDEKGGNKAIDHSGGIHHLTIPSKMQILDKKFLPLPWDRYQIGPGFAQDTFLNLIGFLPLGFILAITFFKVGSVFKRHNIQLAVILCFTVSLTIEIVQAWIPSRSSDSLDLILNTLGGFLGAVICYQLLGARRKAHGSR